jgi:putative addiction module component (TIGR02574 family)
MYRYKQFGAKRCPPHDSSGSAELLEQALKLPPQARLALADELLDSVEGPEDPEWTAAWTAELARRVKQLESGQAKTVPWEEARARILAKLRSR